jgi:threonine dehydratase
MVPNLVDIEKAAARIKPYIHRTPIMSSQQINLMTQADIHFKCENFQKAGAFKSRGACNAVFSLTDKEIKRGVATHSSGNHAQALARAAALRGCTAFIVMPETAPDVKVNAVKHYGGNITFCKPTLESREATLRKIVEQTGAAEIHPYNDYRIIAAQATAAIELIEDGGPFDIVMCPVGGGGLLSGTALTCHYLSPNTRVIAGEPKGADDAFRSYYSGSYVPSVNPRTIADGLLTSLGSLTFPIILEYVDGILTVEEETIKNALQLIWERMKIIAEPSAVVPFAAVLENPEFFKGKKIGIILSGGNIDLKKLPF